MKYRFGFVSNSSSSSFIVAFPRKPESPGEILDLLFDADQTSVKEFDYEFPLSDVVDQIWRDLQRKENPCSDEHAIDTCSCGHLMGIDTDTDDEFRELMDTKDRTLKNIGRILRKHEKRRKRLAKELVSQFRAQNPGCYLAYFHYSDNDGEFFTLMEHGPIFHKLPHIRVSHH